MVIAAQAPDQPICIDEHHTTSPLLSLRMRVSPWYRNPQLRCPTADRELTRPAGGKSLKFFASRSLEKTSAQQLPQRMDRPMPLQAGHRKPEVNLTVIGEGKCPQVINTNVASLNSQRSLNMSQTSLATSLQRLSSGLRINSAKDDAAGLAISARMTSQISGLNQASRNANDGISLAQTAEGGLQSITDSLQRMRELAVQSSNATNTATDRAALQQEVDQLVQQINTVSSQTAFNGVKLLDGTFNSQTFQVGANSGETISINSIASAKADSLGVGTTSSYVTTLSATVTNGAIATGGITVNGYGVGPSVSDGVSSSASITGATATVGAIAGDATDYIKINGVTLGAVAGGAADATAQGVLVIAAINAQSATTGVVATNNAGALTLTSRDGRDIQIELGGTGAANSGLTAATTKAGSDSAIAKAAAFNTVTGQTGVSAVATKTSVTSGAFSPMPLLPATIPTTSRSMASSSARLPPAHRLTSRPRQQRRRGDQRSLEPDRCHRNL
jgi:flagellin